MTSQYDFDEEKKILWFDVFGLVIMFDLSFLLQYITVHQTMSTFMLQKMLDSLHYLYVFVKTPLACFNKFVYGVIFKCTIE